MCDIITSNQNRMEVSETIQEVNNVEYLLIILLFIAIFLCLIPLFKRKPKSTPKKPRVSEYDSEGYNRQGYNEVGRNRQGKYNRYRDFSARVKVLATSGISKPDRIREIIKDTLGKITKTEIMQRCPDISQVTVQRTLNDLVKNGEIVKISGGRYTSYVWNKEK